MAGRARWPGSSGERDVRLMGVYQQAVRKAHAGDHEQIHRDADGQHASHQFCWFDAGSPAHGPYAKHDVKGGGPVGMQADQPGAQGAGQQEVGPGAIIVTKRPSENWGACAAAATTGSRRNAQRTTTSVTINGRTRDA